MRAILDPPRHDQFVGPGGHLGVVASAHVEGLAVRRRPERARTHPQPPHLVGETVDEHRRLRGQREPSGAVVKADARRYQRPRGGIADLELDSAGGRARARRPRAGHLDVAQRERPTGRPHGEIDTAGALTGEPGTIEPDRDLSERRAGFDLDGGTPQPLAAVRVPVDRERLRVLPARRSRSPTPAHRCRTRSGRRRRKRAPLRWRIGDRQRCASGRWPGSRRLRARCSSWPRSARSVAWSTARFPHSAPRCRDRRAKARRGTPPSTPGRRRGRRRARLAAGTRLERLDGMPHLAWRRDDADQMARRGDRDLRLDGPARRCRR